MRLKTIAAMLFFAISLMAQRQEINLEKWAFSRDGQSWEQVRVPHDWAISGPFDKQWDLQRVAIEQNGETEATEKSGRSGALPWIGEGHYRTTVSVPEGYSHAELVFDGAMAEPVVRVNGVDAGGWKYGYNAFRLDVSTLLTARSTIEVDLQNLEESSRWYPGAGLYRPVKLVLTGKGGSKPHIDDWSVFVQTLGVTKEQATLRVEATIVDANRYDWVNIVLKRNDGREVASRHVQLQADGKVSAELAVANPQLWSPESPLLYTVDVELYPLQTKRQTTKAKPQPIDAYSLKTGIRTIAVSKERGFELNGVSRKLKGVCLHHDLGPLGAAVNKAALIRQIRILKDMGCDAIRTAHNMPSAWQMEVCDSMGMMVMAESFDMWIYPKCKNGYARFFKEWADKDVTNLVLNHRNHPSIVMWSVGNEIPEQWSDEGREIAQHLQDLIHKLDPTRPVTQGMDRPDEALKSGFAQVMDVPGFNYRVHKYDNNIRQLPKGFLLGSETASTVSSRGVYKFPVETKVAQADSTGQCSSYDTEYCSWSNLPDDDFLMMDDRAWTIGQFVWTGFDYLGEPTPYDEYWPSRSSYFGICDLAGLPKDRFYLYRSQWNKEEHTLHVLPHWTWRNREGQVTPVFAYTDYPEAELFVNGKSQGRIRKDPTAQQIICNPDAKGVNDELLNRYRLRWMNVVYEPGELKVVAFDEKGEKAAEMSVFTAGDPQRLQLDVEPIEGDLVYVRVSMVDDKGTLVPDADDELDFMVSGAGMFKAACNGDATSLEPFTEPRMRLFNGQLVVVLQATELGNINLTVKDDIRGLESTTEIPVGKRL